MSKNFVETERLTLRNLRESDAGGIFSYRNDENCAKYQRWEDTSMESAEKLIRDFSNCEFLSEEEKQVYAVSLKSGELVGDLTYFFTPGDCITLGYTISPKHQRKGYAYEILCAVTSEIRKKYPKMDIVCLIERENTASIALVKKLGFEEECYCEKIESFIFVLKGAKAVIV